MTLTVENLTVYRGERTILSGLSFEAAAGVALLLTGANGAGKTTLLRTIGGLIAPASGTMRFDVGTADPSGETTLAERCHLVGHLNAIKSSLTVSENARFWAGYLGGDETRVGEALDRLDLSDLVAIRAGYLSAGQKRRLGLSRLLLAPRPIWLLDEPAVSLDQASQALLADIVNRHLAEGGCVVAATHQPLGFAPSSELRLGRSAAPISAEPHQSGDARP